MTAKQARAVAKNLMGIDGRVPAWALEMALLGKKPTWNDRPRKGK